MRRLGLPRHFIAPAIGALAVLAAVAAWTAVDAAALQTASALQARARIRAEGLQAEVERLRISRAQLQATARHVRRLHEIRRSGFEAADRIARFADAVVDGTWIASISMQASSPIVVKGSAAGLDRFAQTIANVVHDPRAGRLLAVRFASDAQTFGRLTFELQMEAMQRGDRR